MRQIEPIRLVAILVVSAFLTLATRVNSEPAPEEGVPHSVLAEAAALVGETDLPPLISAIPVALEQGIAGGEGEIDSPAIAEEPVVSLDMVEVDLEYDAPAATLSALDDPDLRHARIAAHLPSTISTSHSALLPPIVRVIAQRTRGVLYELAEDHESALDAFEICLGLGDESSGNWRRLGRARIRTGDLDGAEGAFLAAYEMTLSIDQIPTASSAPALLELGELYLFSKRFDEARNALAESARLDSTAPRVGPLLRRAEMQSRGEFPGTISDIAQIWPVTTIQLHRAQVETLLIAARDLLPPPARRGLSRAALVVLGPAGFEIGAGSILAMLLLWALVRSLHGHGDLVVAIDYPAELRGSFTVRLSEQPNKQKRAKPGERTGGVSGRTKSSRTMHQMVSRDTQFLGLAPRTYYVVVDGVLLDPENEEVLMTPFDEHAIEVRKGETVRLAFDLRPRECPVDVRVLWDKQPTEDAGVAARGHPQSLRYTRGGETRLRLCKGTHTIVVGSGDRVAEREIRVESFQPTSVVIDFAGSEGVVFKGCPPAVEPYLHGDLNAAARALARDGHNQIANLLLARLHRDQGQTERAAHYFEAAGDTMKAAELRASLKDFSGAAQLFRGAGQISRAAEMYREAEDWTNAGESFTSIGLFREAADCYRESGNVPLWLDALEKQGEYFEAAEIALERSERAQAIRLLQLVPSDSTDYRQACEMLADAFEHEGHADLAVQKMEQRLSAGETSGTLYLRLAELLDTTGDLNRSLEVLEELRDNEPTFPEVATRIESLRKRLSKPSLSQSKMQSGSGSATPTVFLSENRYEIIDELGRGGMGIVYRAKDLRLNREVALKRLPENLRDHPKAVQLFLREAQACARLNHRNIVTIFDTDQDENAFFITMELLTGFPLNVIRQKKGRLAERDVARLSIQVAEGLHYAHAQGIVHRDIKTANLFFTSDRVVKIMDFGLAKMMEEVRRGTTVMGGTPYYMAPEQAQGDRVDQRADIYAFGVTLYELITGTVPFSEGDVSYHHQHSMVPDPRDKAPDISDAMADLIFHMLEKNPQHRCPNAQQVLQRLRKIAEA